MERSARQPEVAGIGLDDHDAPAKPLPQDLGALRVQLDGDDPRAGVNEGRGKCSLTRTHIEDEITAADSAVGYEPFSPSRVELVPTPPPWLCHGDGPLS